MSDPYSSIKVVILWGATGQAKVLRECIQHTGLDVVALFDNDERLASPFQGIPLFKGRQGFEQWLYTVDRPDEVGFLVAIGGFRGRDRIVMQEYLESHGIVALTACHRTAFVSRDAQIAAGSQVLAHASVCVEASIGRACIVNTGATVDHECRLHDGVHICPGAHLAGCVEIHNYATVGTGAILLPRIIIGEGAIVGAGAVVTRDVPPYTVVVGNPARILRRISNCDRAHPCGETTGLSIESTIE